MSKKRTKGSNVTNDTGSGDTAVPDGKRPLNKYTRNDTGNAEALRDYLGEDLLYVRDDPDNPWRAWSGKHWKPLSREGARRVAMRLVKMMRAFAKELASHDEKKSDEMNSWATRCGDIGKLTGMLDTYKSLDGKECSRADFDTDPSIMALKNGTVYLPATGHKFKRGHRREDMVTRLIPRRYSRKSKCPRYMEFLKDKLPDAETREYQQRWDGYSLFGRNPKRKLLFKVGPSNGGKSTHAAIKRAVLGDGLVQSMSLSLLKEKRTEAPRADIVRAMPARILQGSEASQKWELEAESVQKHTGGADAISARLGHKNDYVDQVPAYCIEISVNVPPLIAGAGIPLYNRLVGMPWSVVHLDQDSDTTIPEALVRDEGDGILYYYLLGWDAFCERGLEDMPDQVVEATIKLRESLEDFDVWLAARCEQAAEYATPTNALWADYTHWQEDVANIPVSKRLTQPQWYTKLDARGIESERLRVGGRREDKKIAHRVGIRLAESREREVKG